VKIKIVKGVIKEASFSRVKSKIEEQNVPFVMITAFRGDLASRENLKRQKELESSVKLSGFSWTKMPGSGYKEDEATVVKENSILIWDESREDVPSQGKDLFELGKELAQTYDQDSFIFGGLRGSAEQYRINLYTSDGNLIDEVWAGGPEGFKELNPVADAVEYWSSIAGKKTQFIEIRDRWRDKKASSRLEAMKKQYYLNLLEGMIDGREKD
tara:strand:- start:3911 stop:4549 length:639 start_codon:yes stop_codon:yes gene_type:complete